MFTENQMERLIVALEMIAQNISNPVPPAISPPIKSKKKSRSTKNDIQTQFKQHFQKKYCQ